MMTWPSRAVPLRPGRRGGFTLIELLAVVAMLLLLLSLLMPALARAYFKGRCVVCLSHLRQWGLAAIAYAQDHESTLPRFDLPRSTGNNMWDQHNNLIPSLVPYGLAPEVQFCPFDRSVWAEQKIQPRWPDNSFTLLSSYSWWVPRVDPPQGLSPWDPWETNAVQRLYPRRAGDAVASKLPIVSDSIWRTMSDKPSFPCPIDEKVLGYHAWNDQVDNANAVFVDGHAETHRRDELKERWGGSGLANYHNIF